MRRLYIAMQLVVVKKGVVKCWGKSYETGMLSVLMFDTQVGHG